MTEPTASPEVEHSVSFSTEQVADEMIVARFMNELHHKGLNVSSPEWARLMPGFIIEDLSRHPIAEEYKIKPLAMISPEHGRIHLDHQFENLDQQQQRHVLSHEFGHQLDWFLQVARPKEMADLRNIISGVEPAKISSYVGHLEKNLPNNDQRQPRLLDEAVSETMAQYLTYDRSFAGMMRAKMAQFPENDADLPTDPATVNAYQEYFDGVGSIEEYLSTEHLTDPDNRERLFAAHPLLVADYNIWQKLDEIFSDKRLFVDTEHLHWQAGEAVDDDFLIATLHEPEPATMREVELMNAKRDPKKLTQPTKRGFGDMFNFYQGYLRKD